MASAHAIQSARQVKEEMKGHPSWETSGVIVWHLLKAKPHSKHGKDPLAHRLVEAAGTCCLEPVQEPEQGVGLIRCIRVNDTLRQEATIEFSNRQRGVAET